MPTLTLGRAESMFGAHRAHHRVVYIEPLSPDVHDLTGFEAAIGAGDRVEHS